MGQKRNPLIVTCIFIISPLLMSIQTITQSEVLPMTETNMRKTLYDTQLPNPSMCSPQADIIHNKNDLSRSQLDKSKQQNQSSKVEAMQDQLQSQNQSQQNSVQHQSDQIPKPPKKPFDSLASTVVASQQNLLESKQNAKEQKSPIKSPQKPDNTNEQFQNIGNNGENANNQDQNRQISQKFGQKLINNDPNNNQQPINIQSRSVHFDKNFALSELKDMISREKSQENIQKPNKYQYVLNRPDGEIVAQSYADEEIEKVHRQQQTIKNKQQEQFINILNENVKQIILNQNVLCDEIQKTNSELNQLKCINQQIVNYLNLSRPNWKINLVNNRKKEKQVEKVYEVREEKYEDRLRRLIGELRM